MSKPKQQQPTQARDSALPYLIVRTKGRPRFRRCGIDFGTEWLALERADIGPDIDRRLHEESMLEVRAVTEAEALEVSKPAPTKLSTAELEQALRDANAEIERLQGELARLQNGRLPGVTPPDKDDGKASTARLP